MSEPKPVDPDSLLTPEEVATALRVSTVTVGRWARDGKIPSIELPTGHRRFRRSAVDAILNGASDAA